jgi:hypothetical protein
VDDILGVEHLAHMGFQLWEDGVCSRQSARLIPHAAPER